MKGLKGLLHVAISLVVVFIAAFMLFFIFDSLQKFNQQCKVVKTEMCEKLSGFTLSAIVILLIIGAFIGIIAAIGYILISSLSK